MNFSLLQALIGAGSAIASQALCSRIAGVRFDPLSPLITALSLAILLRVDSLFYAAAAAFLAIGSKFLLRWNGKHVFNPANFGLVVVALAMDGAWISPGQWGSEALTAAGFIFLGLVVSSRAGRWDISAAYLLCFALLTFGRAAYLGDEWTIAAHQMRSGAVLLFAFFMISDPMTTPNARMARMLFACIVAIVGFYLRHWTYDSTGPIKALIFCAPLVPLLDRFFPAAKSVWTVSRESSPCVSSAPS